jgi:phthiocerol/phenolphthiocerol synthesis type-I polyketide synthase E
VLGVPRVGINDNLFDLGGNSLSAVKLAFEMEQSTGIAVALGELFRSPTIAGLVGSMGKDAKQSAAVVVPLQPEGEGTPIFCICGIDLYREFAESLGKSQPVFGVYVEEERAIINKAIKGEAVEISTERLVEAYCQAIARFRPHGPYRLAGLSFGGILAMEVASSLFSRGNEVDLVYLLDAVLPQARHRNWRRWFVYQSAEVMHGKGTDKFRKLWAGLRSGIVSRGLKAVIPGAADGGSFPVVQEAAFFHTAQKWRGQHLVGDFKVILFRASDRSVWGPYTDFDEDCGWRRYVGDRLSIFDAVGGHRSILDRPNVTELGRIAQRFLV